VTSVDQPLPVSVTDYDGDDEHSVTSESSNASEFSDEAEDAMLFIHDNLTDCCMELDTSKYGLRVLAVVKLFFAHVPNLVFQIKKASRSDMAGKEAATQVVDYIERIDQTMAAPVSCNESKAVGKGLPQKHEESAASPRRRLSDYMAETRQAPPKRQNVFDLRDQFPALH